MSRPLVLDIETRYRRKAHRSRRLRQQGRTGARWGAGGGRPARDAEPWTSAPPPPPATTDRDGPRRTMADDPPTAEARPAGEASAGPPGSAGEVFVAFLKLGLTSFGGPIAHLGYFRDELVHRRRWLDEARLRRPGRALPVPARAGLQPGRLLARRCCGPAGSSAGSPPGRPSRCPPRCCSSPSPTAPARCRALSADGACCTA